jgi:hypothetical protein
MSRGIFRGEIKRGTIRGCKEGTLGIKRLRDILIVVVLGSVVIYFVVGFIDNMHKASINNSVVVAEAELACIEDGMICHVGYDSFSSEESAAAYLKSPEHLAKVKAREEQKAEQDKLTNCIVAAKGSKQLRECYKPDKARADKSDSK